MSVWQELKRRKVLRVAGAYIVIAWVLMQVAATLEASLELPGWFDKVAFAVLLLGFPLSLLMSWAYEFRVDSDEQSAAGTNKGSFLAIVAALVVGGLVYSYYMFQSEAPDNRTASGGPTIAVLPFADLSPAGDQAWFADGIAEEILNVLAKTKGLKVTARTSSFHYRGEAVDIPTVAAELNVATVLEGSVRSQGDRIRITAQLISAEDGFHLWSETFDRQLSDIFAVQDEISANIATALLGELGVTALPEKRFSGTRNIDAYSHYLQGLDLFNRPAFDEKALSIIEFERAIELDPEFADAWAYLAFAERLRNIAELREPTESRSLKRALALDPNNENAIATLAQYSFGGLRWLEAEQLFLRAINLAPDMPYPHRRYAMFLRTTGRIRQALNEYYRARDLGSDHGDLTSSIVNTHAYLGEFAEARAYYESELKKVGLQNMRGSEAYFVSLLADGMEDEARAFAAQEFAGTLLAGRLRYFVERLDGDPQAAAHLIEASYARIEQSNRVRWGDIDNFLLAGETQLARDNLPRTVGYGWSVPTRFALHVSPEIDPRYLPFKPNMMLLVDDFPGVPEAYMDFGLDILTIARESGFIEQTNTED